jgi:uncharacterized membrane-anchored protein
MSLKLLAWITLAAVLVIAIWPRIVIHVGMVPVAIPTGALIITVLGAIAAGIGWLIWRRRDSFCRFRSSPYPRTALA